MADYIYAWQEYSQGKWGTIAAMAPMLGFKSPVPLLGRSLKAVSSMRGVAYHHARETGNKVRLARFVFEGVEEE